MIDSRIYLGKSVGSRAGFIRGFYCKFSRVAVSECIVEYKVHNLSAVCDVSAVFVNYARAIP